MATSPVAEGITVVPYEDYDNPDPRNKDPIKSYKSHRVFIWSGEV